MNIAAIQFNFSITCSFNISLLRIVIVLGSLAICNSLVLNEHVYQYEQLNIGLFMNRLILE